MVADTSKRMRGVKITAVGAMAVGLGFFAGISAAAARDGGGIQEFLNQQFGISFAPEPAQPDYGMEMPEDRPLVVRRHRHRSGSRMPKETVAKGPLAPVSIYEDKTLRPGDAVMTAQGIRIFVGSRSTPYRNEDFVAVAETDGLPRKVEKALLAIDRVPRI